MQRRLLLTAVLVLTLLVPALGIATASASHDGMSHPFADDAFQQTWERTDKPVADGNVSRTWMWGPEPYTEGMMEPYADSPGGERLVQYFDKSRMEINNPNATNDGLWYVTNGLLVREMVTGEVQVGDDEFTMANPADVNIVGDPDDADGMSPTYAEVGAWDLMGTEPMAEGAAITWMIDGEGNLTNDASLGQYGVTAGELVSVPGIDHRVASVFWTFMTSQGVVYEDGQMMTENLFENPYYGTGYPITEAYWSDVMIGGSERTALWQCFERRCLTFTPGNPDGFEVEAGNVGQHYYRWSADAVEPTTWSIDFSEINDSNITGTLDFTLDGTTLSWDGMLIGLEEGEHPWHIHGFNNGTEAVCPVDTDDDGIVTFDEGTLAYGGVLINLGMITADDTGHAMVSGEMEVTSSFGDMANNVVIIHGMTIDLDGDGTSAYEQLVPAACSNMDAGETPADDVYEVEVGSLNLSGVSGMVTMSLSGMDLTIELDLEGLEADQSHMMHIHGTADGMQASCPTMDLDTNDNGFIELAEGLSAYGGVIVDLTAFTPEANGDLMGEHTFTLTEEQLMQLGDLTNNVVVVHGLTVDLDSDGTDVYEALLPVACGDIYVQGAQQQAETWTIEVNELNDSGVSGTVFVEQIDQLVKIEVNLTGLDATADYPMGIHGFENGSDASCPTMDDDTDGDGLLEWQEGLDAFGEENIPLGVTDVETDGSIDFEGSYIIDEDEIGDLDDFIFAIYGLQNGDNWDFSIPVGCGDFSD